MIIVVSAWGSGSIDGQVRSVSGAGRVTLNVWRDVKRSSMNSAGYQEFPHRTVGVRTCEISST